MDDTAEMIRQQMEETKSDLTEKIESLEHQVSETVQSTGTAVNATVEAVQETVESVTGAVQGAVQSVSNALNLRRQVHRHPWLVLGGAVAAGYLAYGLLSRRPKISAPALVIVPEQPPGKVDQGISNPVVPATSAALVAAYEAGRDHAGAHRARWLAIDALIGVANAVAIHAVPHVINYFSGNPSDATASPPEGTGEPQVSPPNAQHLRIAPAESVRSGNSVSR